ncbi:MAG: polyprenyl synthetase family protein [Rhodospirillaceae bacterium]|nr:polyprenyl synthetase family protein [Rhodospirillaceae bacterium]
MPAADLSAFQAELVAIAKATNDTLDALLPLAPGPEGRVLEAMRYSALDGGKRLRPFLACASADLFGVPRARSLRAAAAVEMVHCYSLIHDDLPAMDDDDLRRGRPTVHKKYDEATAILAGDALLTEAFAVLADPATHPDGEIRAKLVAELARASGAAGMVGGQMIDLMAATLTLDDAGLKRLQNLKTGCIIAVACRMGAVLAGAPAATVDLLGNYGMDMGLAFQIADDVLDVESTAAETGKATGKDAAAGKATFVSRLGLEGAKKLAHQLAEQANNQLNSFGNKAVLLQQAAMFAVTRRN